MMDLKGKRIFIVEDNAENRIIYQMIFVRQGVTIEFERFGPEAVQRLRHFGQVDLIILDLMLTRGASGYNVFDEIRNQPEFEGVPIVAVSSADASEAILRTRRQGFSGYIAKPIDQTRFPDQLARIMAGESIWDEG
jgi:CheY-like chemotaxis protein